MRFTSGLLLTLVSLIITSSQSHAGFLTKKVYCKLGISYGNVYSTLDDYWDEAYNFGMGTNVLSARYIQLLLTGDMHYFQFDHNKKYPVDIIYQYEDDHISGDNIFIFSLMTKFKVFWIREAKRLYPYNGISLGIIKRTDTHLYSNSPHFPSADIHYPAAFGISLSLGLEYRLTHNNDFILECEYTHSKTKPSSSNFYSLSLIMAFKP